MSIAGVLHTAAPSAPGGTMNVRQRTAPLASFSATRVPRAWLSSLFGPEVPMYTAPCQNVGLPNTLEFSWSLSCWAQRLVPSVMESATSCGPPSLATGTNASGPRGAARSMAALPLIGAPRFADHSSLPVCAFSAYT